jgi:glutamine amidotransferase-like uncharacterized protein
LLEKIHSILIIILISFLAIHNPSTHLNYNIDRKDSYAIADDIAQTDLLGVSVAIYESYLDSRVTNSITALTNMFEWMNATVTILNATEIAQGSLWDYDILAIPEGLGPFHQSWLGPDGLEAIRQWVSLGGSYIGVRGSAAMAVTKSYFEGINSTFDLGLFNGTSIEVSDLDDECIAEVDLNKENSGPNLSSLPDSLSVLFWTGRYFLADEGQEMIVIATYSHNSLPAMIASRYGSGCVFLSSPEPEYEENNDRDGTDYKDDLDDPDSEWPLMLKISQWMVENSTWGERPTTDTTTTNTTTTTSSLTLNETDTLQIPIEIIVILSGIAIIAVILVMVVYSKRHS